MLLSHLPIDYRLWKRLGLFQHGAMDDTTYAFRVFKRHFDRFKGTGQRDGFVGLEFGPGDSLFSALVARAYGASAYYLVDVGTFAHADAARYQVMANFLRGQGLSVPELNGLITLKEILTACRAIYRTSGLDSLRAIPNQSVDFIWSHAVLEHVRRAEFLETMRELHRILSTDGISSHCVDLRDHLSASLNHLRFRESVWESPFMVASGFYTNRIRYSEMLALFEQVGFKADVIGVQRWPHIPTPRSKMIRHFKDLPEDDLCVQVFDVVLRKS